MENQKLLRLHDEPCAFYNERQIHRILMKHTNAFMDILERFYYAWQKNKNIVQQPKKQLFTTPGLKGDWRVMPCLISNFEGKTIKVVKIIGTNEEERIVQDKIAVGKALLINTTDNFVEAIFDVCALSSFRTAAISALAFKHTIDFRDQKVGLIGTGRVGFYTALIFYYWLGIKEISVFDVNKSRISDFKKALSNKIRIKEENLQNLCQNCTAVFLATTSAVPLFKDRHVKKMQFISSVGADANNLSELDQSLLKNRIVMSESRQNVSFGDLRRWHTAGLLKKRDVIELREVIGRPRKKDQPVIFISTGTAVQDALICQFLFKRLKKKRT